MFSTVKNLPMKKKFLTPSARSGQIFKYMVILFTFAYR